MGPVKDSPRESADPKFTTSAEVKIELSSDEELHLSMFKRRGRRSDENDNCDTEIKEEEDSENDELKVDGEETEGENEKEDEDDGGSSDEDYEKYKKRRKNLTEEQVTLRDKLDKLANILKHKSGEEGGGGRFSKESSTSSEDRFSGKSKRKDFVCSFAGCSKVFGRPERLEQHLRVHNDERPFVCDVQGCGKSYTRNEHLRRHEKAHEKKKEKDKRRKMKKKSNSDKDSKYCLREDERVRSQPTTSSLSTSSTSTSFSSALVCSYEGCGKVLKSESSLKEHETLHRNIRFACDDCSNCYPCLKSLNNHVRDVHRPSANIISPEELPSDDDDDNDDNVSVVSSYYDAETKVFFCPHCQKTYKKNWQLKTHLYDHTGELPFRCKHDGCERAFLIRSHLKRHVKQGHRRHRCKEPGCDLIFDSYLESRRHFSAEHFKKMETCPKCGKQVTHHNFKHHLLTHSETRTVFVCTHDNCTRKYLSQHNLDAHVRNDHGPLSSVRLTCTVQGCNKVFKAKATLKRHVLNIHNRPPNESQPKPRKSANRKIRDFARELAGYLDDDDPVEEENGMELASQGAKEIEEPVILEDDP